MMASLVKGAGRADRGTTLVITQSPIARKSNGYDLRVWHLCRALAQHDELILLSLQTSYSESSEQSDIQLDEVFNSVFTTEPLEKYTPSLMRYLRLSEGNLYRLGYPEFEKSVIQKVGCICDYYNIHRIVAFGTNLASLLRTFSGKKKVLVDICDSMSLTMERGKAHPDRASSSGTMALFKKELMHYRWKRLEGELPVWFDHVVTINRMDTETIRRLSGGKSNLSTIPNGVGPEFEQAYHETPRNRRAVAFWGNLSFAPNRDAVKYFYYNVYLPYLKGAGIEFCIVGRDPESWLTEAAKQDPNVRLMGFVDDLREALIDYPIMVNPMRMGSGMKNKVLEAYAMGLAVVSTPLGIESIDGSTAGENYMEAETPSMFYEAICQLLGDEIKRINLIRSARRVVMEKYTWSKVGDQWLNLVENIWYADTQGTT